MLSWVLVGVGGAIGAMTRHGVNGLVHRWALATLFPAGIFVVNILGSAVIGVLAGLLASARVSISPDMRLLLVVGLLGGFTTFSSFSLDTLTLIRGGHLGLAALNVGGQVTLSLLAVAAGYKVAQWL